MVLAIDVYYKEQSAKAVGVLFDWDDNNISETIIEYIADVEEYIPGQFYKRELPCILKILEKVALNKLNAIIIDGYIYVDNNRNYGLGGVLWDKLGEKIPIIGVAKTSFYTNKETVVQVKRGQSNNPLYVSAIGIDIKQAAELVQHMQGNYRIPDVLKTLDHTTKHD